MDSTTDLQLVPSMSPKPEYTNAESSVGMLGLRRREATRHSE